MKQITEETYYNVLRRWEDNVVRAEKGSPYVRGPHQCAFCMACGHSLFKDAKCWLCPIDQDTGFDSCVGTPYLRTCHYGIKETWEEFQYLLNLAYCNGMEKMYTEEI